MKKIVIFIVTILVLGVLAMTTCIQNSKRIEQEKEREREQIANINNEEITVAEDNEIQSNIIEKEDSFTFYVELNIHLKEYSVNSVNGLVYEGLSERSNTIVSFDV